MSLTAKQRRIVDLARANMDRLTDEGANKVAYAIDQLENGATAAWHAGERPERSTSDKDMLCAAITDTLRWRGVDLPTEGDTQDIPRTTLYPTD